jgi:hypothetical protein
MIQRPASPPVETLPEARIAEIDQALHNGGKIKAIQIYREITHASLRDARNLVEERATQIGAVASYPKRLSWRDLILPLLVPLISAGFIALWNHFAR